MTQVAAAHPHTRTAPLDLPIRPEDVVANLCADPGGVALESSLGGFPFGDASWYACSPARVVEVPADRPGEAIGALDTALQEPSGWWIGYLSYEAGAAIEGIASRSPSGDQPPALWMANYNAVVRHNAESQTWTAQSVGANGADDSRELQARLPHLQAAPRSPARPDAGWTVTPSWTRQQYREAARRCLDYIEAGDVYELNLTMQFDVRPAAARPTIHPVDTYRLLRRRNPSPFAALLRCGDTSILSASPELFLSRRGTRVVTRPMKGTRPRRAGFEPETAAELLASEKERAELTMIVDLMRNDLARVCEPGSVRVDEERIIELHPSVLQQVSTVSGELAPHTTNADLLRAAFPCGSITGAPKIRAMQIIREIEPMARGPYCGGVFIIEPGGDLTMNVAIRTLSMSQSGIRFHGGGAIVADSEPSDELNEIRAKTEPLLRAIGANWPEGL